MRAYAPEGLGIACPPLPGSEVHGSRPGSGDLPAIATYAGIEVARCAWRWQAGGRRAELIRRKADETQNETGKFRVVMARFQ